MKKIAVASIVLMFLACGPAKNDNLKKPLYEVLTQQNNGGASIRFFEILTEAKEIKMLQNDENLRKKISPDDISKSNFVILNLGEKSTGGHAIVVQKAEETPSQIVITVKETGPGAGEMAASVMSNPYTILRVNSKKEIVIKDADQ